ncbi:hypothetical protein IKZ40_02535 [bacterium]|nr:hypothetical protein [bacterium]
MKSLNLLLLLAAAALVFGCTTVKEEKEAVQEPAQIEETAEAAVQTEQPTVPSVRHENGSLVIDMVEVK